MPTVQVQHQHQREKKREDEEASGGLHDGIAGWLADRPNHTPHLRACKGRIASGSRLAAGHGLQSLDGMAGWLAG